jgi:AraC-like DNA-binding protein
MRQIIRVDRLPQCALGRVTLSGAVPRSTGVAVTGPLRRWPYHSLIYVVGGRMEYSDERGLRRVLGVGDALLLVPEIRHRFVPHRCESFTELFVSFEGPVFDALRAGRALDPERPYYHLQPLALWSARFAAFHRGESRDESDGMRRIGALVQLITDIAATRDGVAVDADAAWLSRAREALAAAELRHAPERAAAALGLGHAPFRKRFARLAGMPPGRWRMRLALDQAAALLMTEASVAEIAERCGFADAWTFSRRFRAVMGQPPARFRRGLG